MTDLNLILAQAAADGGGSTLVFIFGTMLVFYFFIMRPQLKKQKEARKFRENIAKGDKVVTVGGIHGKVLDVNDKTAILQVAKGEIRVDLAGISSDGAADGEAAGAADGEAARGKQAVDLNKTANGPTYRTTPKKQRNPFRPRRSSTPWPMCNASIATRRGTTLRSVP